MPLPRKKDEGGSGAPVLNILNAHVRLIDVEEKEAPYTVTRKADNAQFTLDPGFNCTVEIIDDNDDGSSNGLKFFENFKYKQDRAGDWFLNSNSKLGMLTAVVKPGYFEDTSIPELTAHDLEGFELSCWVKPKKNPNTGQTTGSTIDWETMRALKSKPVTVPEDSEDDFDDEEPPPEENPPF